MLTPPPIDPVILGACALCGVHEVYAMGGAHGIAALAYGTETIERVDVIAGPGSLIVQEAKRQVSDSVGIDGFYGPSDVLVLADAAADAAARRARPARPGRARPGRSGRRRQRLAPLLLDGRGAARGARARSASTPIRPRSCSCTLRSLRDALAFAEAFAPEHLELVGPAAERLARARALRPAASSSARPARRRSATTSRARTTACRRAARRALRPACRRATSAAASARCTSATRPRRARRRGRADRPRRGLRRARRVDGGPRRGECAAMTTLRRARSSGARRRRDIRSSLGLDGSGAGQRARPASASSTTCSTCSRATGAWTSTSRRRATCRPARTTRSRTSASSSARRSTRRSATAPASTATATPSCRWTRRARCARSTSPGRPFCVARRRWRCPPARPAASSTSCSRSSSAPSPTTRA